MQDFKPLPGLIGEQRVQQLSEFAPASQLAKLPVSLKQWAADAVASHEDIAHVHLTITTKDGHKHDYMQGHAPTCKTCGDAVCEGTHEDRSGLIGFDRLSSGCSTVECVEVESEWYHKGRAARRNGRGVKDHQYHEALLGSEHEDWLRGWWVQDDFERADPPASLGRDHTNQYHTREPER